MVYGDSRNAAGRRLMGWGASKAGSSFEERAQRRQELAAARRESARKMGNDPERRAFEQRVKKAEYAAFWDHGGSSDSTQALADHLRIGYWETYGAPPRVNDKGKIDGNPDMNMRLLRKAVHSDCWRKIRFAKAVAPLGVVTAERLHDVAEEWFPERVEEFNGVMAEAKEAAARGRAGKEKAA